jgi:hypothetical protein
MIKLVLALMVGLSLMACSLLPRLPWQSRQAGPGWQLLASGAGPTEGYVVRVATDEPQLAQMLADLELAAMPEIDLSTHIVASFGHGIGSSCPEMRLDDVVIDAAGRAVYSVASDPLGPRSCTADLVGGAFFVVALDRSALPESPFEVRLTETCPGQECLGDEKVTVDLRP